MFTVVGVVGALLFAACFFILYRRNNRNESPNEKDTLSPFNDPNSVLRSRGNSALDDYSVGTGSAGASNFSPNEKNAYPFPTNPGSTIVPLEVDQRLDPGAMYMRMDHVDSRRSLQDDHDYSRKILRVTNPDYALRGSMDSAR